MLEARSLTFSYPVGDFRLGPLDFQAKPGEAIALLGGDGSGKSTLLHLLAGLAPRLVHGKRSGSLMVAGADPGTCDAISRLRSAGLVFSDPTTQLTGFCASVEEEIAWGLGNLGTAPHLMRERVDEVLEQVGLTSCRHKSPLALSSGQQQLLAIASVLALQPQMLLFDEPAARLDAQKRRQLSELALEQAQQGHTVIWASPNIEDIAQFPRWVYMQDGKIAYDGPPQIIASEALLPAWTRLAQSASEQGKWEGALPCTEEEAIRGFASK